MRCAGGAVAALKIEDQQATGSPASPGSQPSPMPHIGAVESWTLTLAAVDRWLGSAKQGETLTYAHGPSLVRGAAAEHLRRLEQQGEVILCQKRTDPGGFDYRAIRNRVRVVRARPVKPRRTIEPLQRDLVVLLEASARQGRRCPSNPDLAQALGITVEQVKWEMRKAASAGLIRTRLVPAPGDPKFRVVAIVGSGLETAPPEGGRK